MSQHRLTPVQQQQQQQQPRVVLPEEEYQRNLSEVIQRQYFPALPDLQAQALAQQKWEAGDYAGAEAVRRASELLSVHDELVLQAEQEEEEGRGGGGGESDDAILRSDGRRPLRLRSKPRPLHLETLTGFHARVTSEDNADFETEQAEEMRRDHIERSKLLRLTHQEGGTNHSAPPTQHLPRGATPLLLASDAFDAPPDAARPEPKAAPMENGFFFVPNANARSRGELGEESNQRLLMPPPTLSTTTKTSSAPASNQLVAEPASFVVLPANALVEYIPKGLLEKRIEPANTRFPAPTSSFANASVAAGSVRPRHLEVDRTDEDDDESALLSGRDGDGGSATLAADSDTDLDRDSVDGSSVGSDRLNELRRQARKRKEREWQRLVPLSPTQPSSSTTTKGAPQGEASMTPAPSSFQLPPTLPREVVAERAHELAQERSKRAGRQVSSSVSVAGASRYIGGGSTSRSSSMSISEGAHSVRSIFSASSRPPSALSRSALGTALRSAYGGRGGGPASSVVGSSVVDVRSSSSAGRSVRSRSRRREGRSMRE